MAKDVGRRTGGPLLELDSMILGLLILGVRWVEGICACIAKNAKWLTLKLIYCFILHTHTHTYTRMSHLGLPMFSTRTYFTSRTKSSFQCLLHNKKFPLKSDESQMPRLKPQPCLRFMAGGGG